jgi:AcrR family transcriptional regulator
VADVTQKALRSDARRNLELILRAAGEAFAEGGPEVGVADIARRAGVGTATIFRRFPSKDELLAAVFEARLNEMRGLVAQCAAEPGGIATIRAFFDRAIDFQLRDRGFMELVGKRHFAGDPRFTGCRDSILEGVGQMVARAQAAGELRSDVTATDLMVLVHTLGSGATFVDGAAGHFRQRYLDLLVDGLRPEGATELSCAAPSADDIDRAREPEPA